MADIRACEQCGTLFTPRREHARFCSAACRVAWNREHADDQWVRASALDWSITAMCETTERLAKAGAWEPTQAYAVISEAVWWVTIVDATLVRYHLEAYESVLNAGAPAERPLTEGTFAGLRFVRNWMGIHVAPADFIQPGESHSSSDAGRITAWTWKSLPEPALASLPPRGQQWEMTRYQAYETQLVGHTIGETFGRAAAFLRQASAKATSATADRTHQTL
jgi:hypothetical protein